MTTRYVCFYNESESGPTTGNCYLGYTGRTVIDYSNEPYVIAAVVDNVDTGGRFLRGTGPHIHYFPDDFLDPPPLSPNQPHDCINGGCVPQAIYDTPGVFANFAACQSGCAKNSNCTGECIPTAEIAALQQAANNLRSKLCK